MGDETDLHMMSGNFVDDDKYSDRGRKYLADVSQRLAPRE